MSNRAYVAVIKTPFGEIRNIWNGTRTECEQRFEKLAAKLDGEVKSVKSKAAATRFGM